MIEASILKKISAARKRGEKCNILLDLDNTLISSIPYFSINNQSVNYRNVRCTSHVMGTEYIMFERPHVQKLLNFLFKHFNVSVWSAATKHYVLFLVDNVISTDKRKLKYVFHAEHCLASQKMVNSNSPKDLRYLYHIAKIPGFTEDNTFIIDDLPAVKIANPKNCIAVPAFDIEKYPAHDQDTVALQLYTDLSTLF